MKTHIYRSIGMCIYIHRYIERKGNQQRKPHREHASANTTKHTGNAKGTTQQETKGGTTQQETKAQPTQQGNAQRKPEDQTQHVQC